MSKRTKKQKRSAFTLIYLLLGISAALLIIAARAHSPARFALTVTNNGEPIIFVNLGEARWSGAVYQLFSPQNHEKILASADSGKEVEIAKGNYDVLVKYSNGETVNRRWFPMVSVRGNYTLNAELQIDPDAVGPQKMHNTWQP